MESAGMVTWDATGYIILILAREMRQNAACMVDAETVEYDLALIDQAFPALVAAVMEKYSTRQLAGVLRKFLAERLSIRDLPSILERLLHYDYLLTDPSKYIVFGDRLVIHKDIGHGRQAGLENIIQYARAGLKDYISHKYTYGRGQSTLTAYLLDPQLEKRIVEHLAAEKGKKGKKPLAEEEIGTIHQEIRRELSSLAPNAAIPVILTIASIRAFVRDMLSVEFPNLPVLSYDELAPTTNITPITRLYLD
jgi:type III secretion protein V